MIEKSDLLRVPVFADLPDDQIAWFISQSQELRLKAGDTYSRQGDPADAMFVVLEGQLQGRGELAGDTITFTLKPGDVTGVLPFSRMKLFTVSGRAETDSRLLRFPRPQTWSRARLILPKPTRKSRPEPRGPTLGPTR